MAEIQIPNQRKSSSSISPHVRIQRERWSYGHDRHGSFQQIDEFASNYTCWAFALSKEHETSQRILGNQYYTWLGPLRAGLEYQINVVYLNRENRVVARCMTTVRTVFSQDELSELYNKATRWSNQKMTQLTNLTRCKPHEYFDDIQNNHGGLMRTYLKDLNGHEASAINGKLKGLFFAARLWSQYSFGGGSYSFFGDRRLTIPIERLIERPEQTNLYFADFYCNYTQHYVTIVVTKEGSMADCFCAEHLIKMEIDANPFFTV
ncbi:unnamed protein product, partial [Anisakis simplex]|uniref:PHYHIP_C domain-containing protein n=1 Tax=Anisakis simplex TaxID=6269 RepID=A0A0M3J6M3_ANISI